MNAPTPTDRPAGNVTFWLLFLASIATWPALYLPIITGFAGGIGGFAFVAKLWWPALVLVNVVILILVGVVVWQFRPRQIAGKVGAGLAAAHSAFFVAISLPHVLKFL